MTPEYWNKATAIFHHACELHGAKLEQYLSKACNGDKALLQMIKSLLRSDAEQNTFMDEPLRLFMAHEKDRSGETIGHYELLRIIGKGGMGTVYLATPNKKPFTRYVALKVMNSRRHSAKSTARFLLEMRILATFQHEAIARLYDGGITDEGEHFFVMEYVDGKPIDQYCDEQALSLKERLILFQKVCFAVQEAHKIPIVHRDIKPNNIIVTKDGTPKLLDFGIATILDNQFDSDENYGDMPWRSVLTPRYASPEQLALNAEPVTIVSDIFSLGIILYELLTGCHPFLTNENSIESIKKIIMDCEPTKPSTILKKRKISNDLNRIILKAIDKDPHKRYDAALSLAEDIKNYLEHRPLTVRRLTLWYRFGKYLRRNSFAAFSFAALLILSIAFGVQSKIQAEKLSIEQKSTQQMNNFLISLFSATDPNRTKGDTLTAFDLLQRGTMRITTELRDQPVIQAKLLHAIGHAYYGLGDYARADTILRKSIQTFEIQKKALPREFVFSLSDLAKTLQEAGSLKEAEELAKKAFDTSRKAFGLQDVTTLICLTRIGSIQMAAGKHANALKNIQKALEIRKKILPKNHPDIADNLNELGLLSKRLGKFQDAEAYYQKAIDMKKRLHGLEYSTTAITINNLAVLYETQGRFALADSLHRQVLEIFTKIHGPEHPRVLYSLNNLGVLLTKQGRYDEAEQFLQRALSLRKKILGEHHRLVAATANNLAVNYMKKGDYRKADSLYEEAIDIIETTLGHEHRLVPLYQTNRANILNLTGKVAKAESLLTSALKTNHKIYGEKHWQIARNLNAWGTNQLKKRNYEEAERYYKEALTMFIETLGPEHYRVAGVYLNLAKLYQQIGKFKDARDKFEKAVGLKRKILRKDHPDLLTALTKYGEFLVQQGELAAADKLFHEAQKNHRAR